MVACGNGNTRAREDAATAEVKGGWWWCRRLCGGRFSLCVPFCCFIFVTFCLFVCLLALRACVRESELVGGALHTIRFGFLAALELWVAKNNHSLSLSLFLFLPLTLSLCC